MRRMVALGLSHQVPQLDLLSILPAEPAVHLLILSSFQKSIRSSGPVIIQLQ